MANLVPEPAQEASHGRGAPLGLHLALELTDEDDCQEKEWDGQEVFVNFGATRWTECRMLAAFQWALPSQGKAREPAKDDWPREQTRSPARNCQSPDDSPVTTTRRGSHCFLFEARVGEPFDRRWWVVQIQIAVASCSAFGIGGRRSNLW